MHVQIIHRIPSSISLISFDVISADAVLSLFNLSINFRRRGSFPF